MTETNLIFKIEEENHVFTLGEKYESGGGTSNYNLLYNKPSINLVELMGNKTSEELGLEPTIVDITEQDIDQIVYGG